ncbi:hypothetical protein BJX70DRAFT_365759 [Aspergillus crustosus]
MDLPQATHFINDLLLRLSHYTTQSKQSENENELESPTQRYSRQTQAQPPSASQLANIKPLMLTLHCIFPNEFLLALDILDRGLIRRIRTQYMNHHPEDQGSDNGDIDTLMEDTITTSNKQTPEEDFFFVTSASTIESSTISYPASQAGNHPPLPKAWQEKGYEVRLQAWNCTCPAFTLSASRDLGPEPLSPASSSSSSSASNQMGDTEEDNNLVLDQHSAGDAREKVESDVEAVVDADTPGTIAHAYSFGGTLPLHPESAPPVCKHALACLLAALCPGLGAKAGRNRSGRFVTLNLEEVAALCAGWGG